MGDVMIPAMIGDLQERVPPRSGGTPLPLWAAKNSKSQRPRPGTLVPEDKEGISQSRPETGSVEQTPEQFCDEGTSSGIHAG